MNSRAPRQHRPLPPETLKGERLPTKGEIDNALNRRKAGFTAPTHTKRAEDAISHGLRSSNPADLRRHGVEWVAPDDLRQEPEEDDSGQYDDLEEAEEFDTATNPLIGGWGLNIMGDKERFQTREDRLRAQFPEEDVDFFYQNFNLNMLNMEDLVKVCNHGVLLDDGTEIPPVDDGFIAWYGRRRSGKSWAIAWWLYYSCDFFANCWVISPTNDLNDAYTGKVHPAYIMTGPDAPPKVVQWQRESKLDPVLSKQAEWNAARGLPDPRRGIIIFDDTASDAKTTRQQTITTLATLGRHLGCQVHITTQWPSLINPASRSNSDVVLVFAQDSLVEAKAFHDNYGAGVPQRMWNIMAWLIMDMPKGTGLAMLRWIDSGSTKHRWYWFRAPPDKPPPFKMGSEEQWAKGDALLEEERHGARYGQIGLFELAKLARDGQAMSRRLRFTDDDV